jgi:hypothetical protein
MGIGAQDMSIGSMLGSYAETRVRRVLDDAARSLDAHGTPESKGFATERRRRIDELSTATTSTVAAGESADAIWTRVQAASTAQFGQAGAIMDAMDASDRQRDSHRASGSKFSDAFSAFDMFG